jgi:hypothetical protein
MQIVYSKIWVNFPFHFSPRSNCTFLICHLKIICWNLYRSFKVLCPLLSRSQQPRGLRLELVSLDWTLVSWVRIPQGMDIWCVYVFILYLCCSVCR